jgi:hypothetical protein
MSDQEDSARTAPVGEGSSVAAASELMLLRDVARRDAQELENLRGQLLATTDAAGQAMRRLAETGRQLEQAKAATELLEHSASFRLGNALVRSVKSPRDLWQLPRTLWQLGRDLRRSASPNPITQAAGSFALTSLPDLPIDVFTRAEGGSPRKSTHAPVPVSDLRVAAIMDEFTRACFMPTCRMQSLHAQHYEQQLLDSNPDLLFVESAWRGEADSWRNMIASRSGELLGLLDMCRRRSIPTVFWNKEDPSHFDTFIETARLFDHVLTTDIDCIQRYRDALGHDRIHLLPFACQPQIHHPVLTGARQPGFCFAGSYYHQYPERCEDFDRVLSAVSGLAPVVIHDRNSERGDAAFAFPERYAALLQPALPYERIDEAYKGYRFSINMNTIKQSQTMFARRVYELMACNTIVVSNYSRGMRSLFGDLAVATDQPPRMRERLQSMIDTPDATRRLRLLALRKVLQQHTYAQRMQHVAKCVLGESLQLPAPFILVVARVHDEQEVSAVIASYRRQHHLNRLLLLVITHGTVLTEEFAGPDIDVIREIDAAKILPGKDFQDRHIARLHPEDYYGPHYLSDLALATQYSDANYIGKGCQYQANGDRVTLVGSDRYRPDSRLCQRSSMARCAALDGLSLSDWMDAGESSGAPLAGLSIDEFSYCRGGAGRLDLAVDVDGGGIDQGVDIATVLERAEALVRMKRSKRAKSASEEVNDRRADFRATLARNKTLVIAAAENQLGQTNDASDQDFFLWTGSSNRSFREVGRHELMQGDELDLDDLLYARSYERIYACAPEAALCRVLETHAASHMMDIRLTDADLVAAAATPAMWVGLVSEGFPRLRVILDHAESAGVLAQLLDRRLPPGLCRFA